MSVKQTLSEIEVGRSSFYEKQRSRRQVWNKIAEWEKERVLEVARGYPEKSCREIARQLCRAMKAEDVKNTLDMAIEKTRVEHVRVVHWPRLLSDNGGCFISHELKKYLEVYAIPRGHRQCDTGG